MIQHFRLRAFHRNAVLERALMVAGLVALVAACAGQRATPDNIVLGNNRVGEACRLVASATRDDAADEVAAYDLFCGGWETPSGRLSEVSDIKTLDAATSWIPWQERLRSLGTCEAPRQTTILDGVAALGLDCSLGAGGWPYQAFIARIDGQTWFADGIPTVLPPLERAVGALTGRLDAASATQEPTVSAEMARLEARLAGGHYSMGDLGAFQDLLRLAQYYNYQGRYAEAEERYRRALALQQKVATASTESEAFVLIHLAVEVSNQQRFGEADALFKRAESLVATSLTPSDDAMLLSYRAIHEANRKRFAEAAALAKASVDERTAATDVALGLAASNVEMQIGVDNSVRTDAIVATAQSLYIEGAMRARLGDYDKATALLSQALSMLNGPSTIVRRWRPQILMTKAEVAEARGHDQEAESFLVSAINEQRTLFTASRDEALAWFALGRLRGRTHQLDGALDAFRKGVDALRESGGSMQFSDIQSYLGVALDVAKQNPDQKQALLKEVFEAAQMVRGTVTAQTLALTVARLAANDADAGKAIRALQDARRYRDELVASINRAQTDASVLAPQLAKLEADFKTANQRIANLERQVQAAAPRYNQIVDAPVSADRLQAALAADEALFEVLVGPSSSLVFYVDPSGIVAYEIPLSEPEARAMVGRIRAPFDAVRYDPFDSTEANRLYTMLFHPVRDRLRHVQHLVVTPTGPLLSLPFGVLVEEAPPPGKEHAYSELAWFARDKAISVAPSPQSFLNLRESAKQARGPHMMVGFGDFVPNPDAEKVLTSRGVESGCSEEFEAVARAPALPGTATELREVAHIVGPTDTSLVLGDAFSEKTVRTDDLADYRIVYFATHGLLPDKRDCWSEPSLLTSRPGSSLDPNNDGLLTSSEIAELQLDADLVVLSACNTGGADRTTSGESLSGLARSFFYAGARSMLVTHWEIPDTPTVELMVATFDGLSRQHMTTADALRAAQIHLIQDKATAHPLNWGAFSLVGDGGRGLDMPTAAASQSAG